MLGLGIFVDGFFFWRLAFFRFGLGTEMEWKLLSEIWGELS
jgi:hypothetical protein